MVAALAAADSEPWLDGLAKTVWPEQTLEGIRLCRGFAVMTPALEKVTLVACLTPPGQAAVATLAVDGPRAWEVVRSLFRTRRG